MKNLLLVSIIFLGACSTSHPPTLEAPQFNYSQNAATCASKPPKPVGDYTQKDVAIYIERWSAAFKDCKLSLSSFKAEADSFNQEIIVLNKKLAKIK